MADSLSDTVTWTINPTIIAEFDIDLGVEIAAQWDKMSRFCTLYMFVWVR